MHTLKFEFTGKLNHVTNDMVKSDMGVTPVQTALSENVQVLDWTIETPVIGIAEDQVMIVPNAGVIVAGAHLHHSRCTVLAVRLARPGHRLDHIRF